MSHRIAFNRARQRHFIKAWRKHRGYSQGKLAEIIGTSVPNLSRIETGAQPYTQDFLEACAEALMIDAASLIMRDPEAPELIWSLWEAATPYQQQTITDVAEAIVKRDGTDG